MFEKLAAFTKKVSDLSDRPSLNASELKAQFDAAPDEVRQSLNKLIDALSKTTAGDSGAKNVGATTITGLTGSDVQTLLEALKTKVDELIINGTTTPGNFYTKFPDGTLICRLRVDVTDIPIATAYGAGFITDGASAYKWTFPVAFVGFPSVTVGEFAWGNGASWGSVISASATSANLRGHDFSSRPSGTTVKIAAIAIGKWK